MCKKFNFFDSYEIGILERGILDSFLRQRNGTEDIDITIFGNILLKFYNCFKKIF